MLPDNIDDLFRQQLGGHATPPAPDLWARVQLPTTETDPVDATFQAGLRGHATPPRQALWERLEEEHLRPRSRRRRVVAWWQLSAAAVLLGLLLGGGLLWRGSGSSLAGNVAQLPNGATRHLATQPAVTGTKQHNFSQLQPARPPQDLAVATTSNGIQKKNKENRSAQATALPASTSSTPIAATTRPRRAATGHRASSSYSPFFRQQPDAATGTLAATKRRKIPASQSLPTSPATTTLAVASQPHSNDTPVLAAVPTAAPAATPEIIEVEVRRGPARPAPASATLAAADAPPARRRGLRLGGLLRQADHLVHGEAVSLAEATGLPETMTLQARLGGRLVSKTIQL